MPLDVSRRVPRRTSGSKCPAFRTAKRSGCQSTNSSCRGNKAWAGKSVDECIRSRRVLLRFAGNRFTVEEIVEHGQLSAEIIVAHGQNAVDGVGLESLSAGEPLNDA